MHVCWLRASEWIYSSQHLVDSSVEQVSLPTAPSTPFCLILLSTGSCLLQSSLHSWSVFRTLSTSKHCLQCAALHLIVCVCV